MLAIIASALWGVLMMLSGAFSENKSGHRNLAIAGMLVLCIINGLEAGGILTPSFKGMEVMFNTGHFALVFNQFMLMCTLIYFILSGTAITRIGKYSGEYFALIFFITSGMLMMSSYQNLLILFLGIEIMSIPQYILAGSDKGNMKSNEASLKYFLMGSFSTGILLMGITLLYGSSGTFMLGDVTRGSVAVGGSISGLAITGLLLMVVAFAFKVSAAPMHFWTPDVYDGTPTPFTSFMATVAKAAAFVGFIRLVSAGWDGLLSKDMQMMIALITALTLLIGNLTAVMQQSVKRMLAYSSIAQAGFMLFAVLAAHNQDMSRGAITLYAVSYSLATIGLFGVMLKMKDYTYDGFNGLARKEPVLALSAAIFVFSLAGIPMTAGFFGKYMMLNSLIQQGIFFWLVIFAVLMAAVSVFYYFRLIMAMYFKEGEAEMVEPATPGFKLAIGLVAIAIIIIGIMPSTVLAWVQ
jgi:NADH-quinone oxidoreductase subunit N